MAQHLHLLQDYSLNATTFVNGQRLQSHQEHCLRDKDFIQARDDVKWLFWHEEFAGSVPLAAIVYLVPRIYVSQCSRWWRHKPTFHACQWPLLVLLPTQHCHAIQILPQHDSHLFPQTVLHLCARLCLL